MERVRLPNVTQLNVVLVSLRGQRSKVFRELSVQKNGRTYVGSSAGANVHLPHAKEVEN